MTGQIRISFIVPTCGRPSLYATLASILTNGMEPNDEIIVVGDGPQPEAKFITDALRPRAPRLVYHEHPRLGVTGGPLRQWAMPVARGTHLSFMDDDDIYTLGALLRIRERIALEPTKILIFKMKAIARRLAYDVLWRTPDAVVGNIGTPMLVVPNIPEKLGNWGGDYCGDFRFLETTMAKHGPDCISWVDDVIAEIR